MIVVGSLFGGIVVDHYNKSTLIYSVLPCLAFAIARVLLRFFGVTWEKPLRKCAWNASHVNLLVFNKKSF